MTPITNFFGVILRGRVAQQTTYGTYSGVVSETSKTYSKFVTHFLFAGPF